MPFSEGLALPGVYAVPARVVNFALSFLCWHRADKAMLRTLIDSTCCRIRSQHKDPP